MPAGCCQACIPARWAWRARAARACWLPQWSPGCDAEPWHAPQPLFTSVKRPPRRTKQEMQSPNGHESGTDLAARWASWVRPARASSSASLPVAGWLVGQSVKSAARARLCIPTEPRICRSWNAALAARQMFTEQGYYRHEPCVRQACNVNVKECHHSV